MWLLYILFIRNLNFPANLSRADSRENMLYMLLWLSMHAIGNRRGLTSPSMESHLAPNEDHITVTYTKEPSYSHWHIYRLELNCQVCIKIMFPVVITPWDIRQSSPYLWLVWLAFCERGDVTRGLNHEKETSNVNVSGVHTGKNKRQNLWGGYHHDGTSYVRWGYATANIMIPCVFWTTVGWCSHAWKKEEMSINWTFCWFSLEIIGINQNWIWFNLSTNFRESDVDEKK